MFDFFGSGMPLAARFFIAFLVVLALIGVTAWLVRRFAANRLGNTAARGRQPRLAVIDAANVDARRRLVLIRRDNVEHLLMIGGPTDVVVEPNIVRAAAARDQLRVGGGADATARAAPAVETGWPLQPLTEPPPVAPVAPPAPPPLLRSEPPMPRVAAPSPVLPPEPSPAGAQTDHNLAEMALQLEAALRRAPMPESRPPVTDPLAAQTAAPAPRAPKIPEPPPRAPLREFKSRVEPRLEPKPELKPAPKLDARAEPKLEARPKPEVKPEIKPEPKYEAKPEPKAEARPEPAPAPEQKPFDSLEEEMASLLGRPSGKS